MSSLLQACLLYSYLNAFLTCIALGTLAYLLKMHGERIFDSLYVKKGTEISGRFEKKTVMDPTNIRLGQIN